MTDPSTILIVEDERKIAELLRDYLQQAEFNSHWIANGSDVCQWVQENNPALVLLDIMLPGKDGLDVCRDIRAFSSVPIVMITAKVDEIDRVIGLELGADDYICKPFSPREVIARTNAILRRVNLTHQAASGTYRDIKIDRERFQVIINSVAAELTPVEFRLLDMLVGQPGRVFSRDQLMTQIYTDNRIVSDRTVDSHIKNLRQKIAPLIGDDEIIRSIYGVGYKLE